MALHRRGRGDGALFPPPAALLLILCSLLLLFALGGMGYRFYHIVSGSMGEAVPVGSLTVVQPVEADMLRVGDVIAYRSDSIIITHRICEMHTDDTGERVIVAKGDSNPAPDSAGIYGGQVVGRVVLMVPFLGAVLGFFSTKVWGWLTLAGLAALVLGGAVMPKKEKNSACGSCLHSPRR